MPVAVACSSSKNVRYDMYRTSGFVDVVVLLHNVSGQIPMESVSELFIVTPQVAPLSCTPAV